MDSTARPMLERELGVRPTVKSGILCTNASVEAGGDMRARLIPIDGGDPVEIVKDLILIGRGQDCELRLDHKSVSKRHCVLVKTDGLVLIRDLGSTNGTRVNGQRVRRGTLLPNDVLSVANFRFTLKFGDGPSGVSATESLGSLSRSADDSNSEPPKGDPVRRNTLSDDYSA